jgi:steroid delta-isomerase-like uncharacterized protein
MTERQPMPQTETKSLIAAYLEALNIGDVETLLGLLDEDVAHDINQGSREIGVEKFRWFLGQMRRHYRETLNDIVIMASEDGHHAAAEFTIRGTYLATAEGLPEASGQNYSLAGGIFFEIDDGRINRISDCRNLTAWSRQLENKQGF